MPYVRNIRSIHVQACQTSDLAFNMPGVIAFQNFDQVARTGPAFLGQRVTRFDIDNQIYGHLADPSLDPARMKFNSREIKSALSSGAGAPFLFSLRNEGLAASLDQAIEQRAAAFLDKYKYGVDLKAVFDAHNPDIVGGLNAMKNDLTIRQNEVLTELTNQGWTGARISKSVTKSPLLMMASSTINPGNPLNLENQATVLIKDKDTNDTIQRQLTDGYTASVPMRRDPMDGKWKIPADPEVVTQSTISETVVHPIKDTTIVYHQNRIAVLKDLIQHKSLEAKLPTFALAMSAELAAIDLGVRTLQLNYVHTFLTSPIAGLVTAIYKDVGESVEPGEPVMRVENDTTILFVGRVQFRDALWPGRPIQWNIVSVFEKEGKNIQVGGKVVAVRGHSA